MDQYLKTQITKLTKWRQRELNMNDQNDKDG
jgi:hypothetical protein